MTAPAAPAAAPKRSSMALPNEAELMKMKKTELLALAEELGAGVTDAMTKAEIIKEIQSA